MSKVDRLHIAPGHASGGCEIRTREGLPPTRFPSVRPRPLGESSAGQLICARPRLKPGARLILARPPDAAMSDPENVGLASGLTADDPFPKEVAIDRIRSERRRPLNSVCGFQAGRRWAAVP